MKCEKESSTEQDNSIPGDYCSIGEECHNFSKGNMRCIANTCTYTNGNGAKDAKCVDKLDCTPGLFCSTKSKCELVLNIG